MVWEVSLVDKIPGDPNWLSHSSLMLRLLGSRPFVHPAGQYNNMHCFRISNLESKKSCITECNTFSYTFQWGCVDQSQYMYLVAERRDGGHSEDNRPNEYTLTNYATVHTWNCLRAIRKIQFISNQRHEKMSVGKGRRLRFKCPKHHKEVG